jgi:3-oxoacyl-[acyl-carrier protein] reductase
VPEKNLPKYARYAKPKKSGLNGSSNLKRINKDTKGGVSMRLTNKVAIITGAASGIGQACAIVFAGEGAKVAAADINDTGGQETVDSIKTSGGEAFFVHTDVAVASEAENLIRVTTEKLGRIDILLNVAGKSSRHIPIEDIDEALWDSIYAVNVKGIFHTMKYAIPHMKKARSGAIINVAAMAGITPPVAHCSVYASSKGAAITLTKAAALELLPYQVRVNCINPTGTDTPMMQAILNEIGLKEAGKAALAQSPLGRLIKPEEVAYAAVYLASDEALMLSGTCINVNAGVI